MAATADIIDYCLCNRSPYQTMAASKVEETASVTSDRLAEARSSLYFS